MTHDLFKSFAHNFNFRIDEIVISDLKEGVFFAKIVCDNSGEIIEIDARPSDAIAIGLRFDVPIYTYETILSEAGIVLSDEEEEDADREKAPEIKKSVVKKEKKNTKEFKDLSVEKLQELLDVALKKEDYEEAAKIRDEINKRN